MIRLAKSCAALWRAFRWKLLLRWVKFSGRLLRWLDPLKGTDEVRYKSAREIVLDQISDGYDDPASDFYVPPWEVPDDSDYEPIELSPELQARETLFLDGLEAHAERIRRNRRRRRAVRRRRVVAFAGSIVLGAFTVGAGASALITGSTGSEEIDSFLHLKHHHDSTSPVFPSTPRPDTRPRLDSASEPFRVPIGRGATHAEAVAYLANDGRFCFVISTPIRSRGSDAVDNVIGCSPPSSVYRQLDHGAAFFTGRHLGRTIIVSGYADETVTDVAVTGPFGRMRTQLSDPWTPDVDGAQPLRAFVATDLHGFGRSGLTAETESLALNPANYKGTARLADGDTAPIQD